LLFGKSFASVQELNRYRKELSRRGDDSLGAAGAL
jgi:hypothetical protein